ncbi:hypothetical protein ADIMK_3920 [Marinobacterium lacunae]|uniref:Uncharacterized protein n=1 Tax=Marinobacterium lacunae TaxID=1232683 RepID=A0A081FTB8_9GAMM|nr:hypothetical protein ADIMK_3920 [Marinobacterium lacunae]
MHVLSRYLYAVELQVYRRTGIMDNGGVVAEDECGPCVRFSAG